MTTIKELRDAASRLSGEKIYVSVVQNFGVVNITINVAGVKNPIIKSCDSKNEAMSVLTGISLYQCALKSK